MWFKNKKIKSLKSLWSAVSDSFSTSDGGSQPPCMDPHRAPRSQKKKRSEWFCSIIVASCIAPSSAAFLVRVRLQVQQHLLQLFQRNNLSSVSGRLLPVGHETADQGGILVRCPNPQLALFIAKEHQLYSEKPQTPDRGSSFLQDVSTISLFQSSPTARGRGWEQEPETLPPHREAGHPQRIYWA